MKTGLLLRMILLLCQTHHAKSFRPSHLFRQCWSPFPSSPQISPVAKRIVSSHPYTQFHMRDTVDISQSSASFSSAVWGGDFAGHAATLSPTTGTIIPVPEYLVPESMVEWGQIPNVLECITSEDFTKKKESNEGLQEEDTVTNPTVLERRTVTVLPEVGCGIDNLETQSKVQSYDLSIMEQDPNSKENGVEIHASYHVEDKAGHNKPMGILNVVFGRSIPNQDLQEDDTCETSTTLQRLRVTLYLNLSPSSSSTPLVPMELKSPMEVIQERQTSTQSSKGQIADGGGLDARTVMTLIGKSNVNQPFTDRERVRLDQIGNRAVEDMWSNAFVIPGNVLVEYDDFIREEGEGSYPWRLQLSYLGETNTSNGEWEIDGSIQFTTLQGGNHNFEFRTL